MAEMDEDRNRLTLKLVYYGPALSGKTTNLACLHDILTPELKSELMILETDNDRTLFFDLLPLGMKTPSGMLIKVKLFTVPGQVAHDSTRKAVLSRADGVVFVADSQRTQSINNAEAFANLAENSARVGLDFERLPLVVQFNKRDLPEVLGEEEINQRWGESKWPVVFSSAVHGQGVEQTFKELLRTVFARMDEEYRLQNDHGVDVKAFMAGITGMAANG